MGLTDEFTTWLGRVKSLYELSKNAKNVELAEALADLRVSLSEWKFKTADLEEENLELKAQVKKLEEQLSASGELDFREGVYYRANPVQGKPNGPFCPICWEDGGKLITLTPAPALVRRDFGTRFMCPNPECKASIQ